MNIDHLKTFCLIVEEGSITAAAKLSFLSQPAVTRQLHQLESYYGTLLFERAKGNLKITKTGEMLYPIAKSIVKDFQLSKEIIQQAKNSYNQVLNVGASFTIGEFLLPKMLGDFKNLYPETNVTLTIKNTPGILEDLSEDVIDIALVEGHVEDGEFSVEKFSDDYLILVCPPNHPWDGEIPVEALKTERMIWREPHSGTRHIVENFLKENGILHEIESYMVLGSMQAIKSAVEAGLGISIMPKLVVKRELELGLIKKVDMKGVHLTRSLWMVRKNQRFQKEALQQFVTLIHEKYAENQDT